MAVCGTEKSVSNGGTSREEDDSAYADRNVTVFESSEYVAKY